MSVYYFYSNDKSECTTLLQFRPYYSYYMHFYFSCAAVILISTGIAVVPTAMRVHDVKHWYRLALVVLVSACPCALVLSTPVATYCALTKAASVGLLIKGGDFLESLANIKIIAFDKTGTITRGEFTLIEFRSLSDGITIPTLLYW